MCLAIPGKVVSISGDDPLTRMGKIDFSGVLTFSPSWGDEFLGPLFEQLGDKLVLLPSDNMSVQATLKILQEINKRSFVIREQ